MRDDRGDAEAGDGAVMVGLAEDAHRGGVEAEFLPCLAQAAARRLSPSSMRPPGKAIWPPWSRRPWLRWVRITPGSGRSVIATSTAASRSGAVSLVEQVAGEQVDRAGQRQRGGDSIDEAHARRRRRARKRRRRTRRRAGHALRRARCRPARNKAGGRARPRARGARRGAARGRRACRRRSADGRGRR